MVYKRFGFLLALRVVILFGFLAVEAYVVFQTDWMVSGIILGASSILIAWELMRFVNKTNRDLASFLQSIRHQDFTASFSSGKKGPSFEALKDSFNDIIRQFRQLQAEKESHYQYLQTVIEHIGVALICFDDSEEVVLMNDAAKDLLSKPYMKKIGAIGKVDENMLKVIRRLESGQKELIKVVVNGELLQIALHAAEFKLMDQYYKLLSLQDIRNELYWREVEAWQKLIRVLTHEIMNSVTPLTTLSGVLQDYLRDENGVLLKGEEIDEEAIDDLSQGLATIESRTEGMMRFVQAYRSILKIPKPDFQEVIVQDLLTRIGILLQSELQSRNVDLRFKFPEEALSIQADPGLIEQVLINLVKNAMEAIGDRPNGIIEVIAARPKATRTLIQVKDNGQGIDEEYVDKVFVPFFTTKKEGTGIGLSLSRQIMGLHRGSITMQTQQGLGTVFTLEF